MADYAPMTSSRTRWATMATAAVALLLLSAFTASKKPNSVPFMLGVAAVSVILLCVLDQLLFSAGASPGFLRWFGAGFLRGGVIGLASWLGMMLCVRIFIEVGDKFPLFVVGFLPFALAFGAVVGCLARGVAYGLRCLHA